ncbi:hypothetical protein I7V34_12490 [Bacillus sp. V3]|nr:hypothetical protein I7V34_12490 [Bacillus sp. V3]
MGGRSVPAVAASGLQIFRGLWAVPARDGWGWVGAEVGPGSWTGWGTRIGA